ncbi:MAG: glucosamine-6-phosphate deaminase [Synechococcaceae bacterium WB8_1B_136]|nr:glucosamine-6-phosphate deaminase [Synechococcaceae bacterium WB8_1B_136]
MAPAATLLRLSDAAAVAEAAAERLLGALAGSRPVGLATGRTMEPVYAALRRRLAALPAQRRAELLAGWRSFNLDEYVGLAPSDPRSFAAAMATALAAPLELRPGQLQLPDGSAPWPEQEAQRYAVAVAAAGGIGLQLLGLGSNGHVGFNEPPCGADAPCRCLELTPATALQNAAAFGGDPAAVPRRAITLGMVEILAAEQILLVVTGAAKAEILRRALEEPPSAALPASWLLRHPQLTVLMDPPAASRLALS